MPGSFTTSVLFVCLGNICRSPAGESVMRHLVEHRGLLESIAVDSAGTHAYHVGDPADRRMIQAARRRRYVFRGVARKIHPSDLTQFDLIIAMDDDNYQNIQRMGGRRSAELRLLSSFLGDPWPADVPDPYYGGAHGFELVLDMIEAACPQILDYLQSQNKS